MKRYMIGEVAKISGLSVHTLRYYEKHDLVKPSYVDEETNYRYYTAKDVEKIEMLKECKKMDLTLEEIRKVAGANSNEEIIEIIKHKQTEIVELLEHYEVVLKNIEWYRKEYDNLLNRKRKCYVPYVQHMDRRKVIYRENPYEESSSSLALAEISREQLQKTDVILKKMGFIAKTKYWELETSLRVKGEYIDCLTDDYRYTNPAYVYNIPGGTYLCMNIAHDSSLEDDEVNINTIPQLALLKEYMTIHNYIPKMIVVEEYAQSLKIFDRVRCQVQILLEVQEDV